MTGIQLAEFPKLIRVWIAFPFKNKNSEDILVPWNIT